MAAKVYSPKALLLRYHQQFVLFIIGACIFFILEGHIFGFFGDLDVCAVDRFSMQINQTIQWKTHRYLSSFVFSSCVWAMIVFLLTLVTWSEDRVENPRFYMPRFQWDWNTFFGSAFLPLWYGSTYALLTALKELLGDSTCGGEKNNGISGHFSFFFFYGVSLPFLALVLIRGNSRVSLHNVLSPKSTFHFKLTLLSLCYTVFFFGALYALSQTWGWGYHSKRQILYGIVFGLGSHLVLREVFQRSPSSGASRISEGSLATSLLSGMFPISCLALFTVVSFALVLLFTSSVPFNSIEVTIFSTLWPALAYSFYHLRGRVSLAI